MPQKFINIPEIPSELFQKLAIMHHNTEIKNSKSETQAFTCTNVPENTKTSLDTSPIENMETIIHSQQTDIRTNGTTETDFNSTLLDDGTLFSSHTVNTLIDLDNKDQNSNDNNNQNITTNTTDNTHNYQNQQHKQSVSSKSSDQLNTTLPKLPNVNTPLPRLHRQHSVHFNTEPVILNNSTQPAQIANQNIKITPRQLVNIVRQLNSQNTQQKTNAPIPLIYKQRLHKRYHL